ncbi:MAG: hypothetical protein ACPF9D_13625, partial [Owenweeksia sp.]
MTTKRWMYLILGAVGLMLVYLFQAYLDLYSILFQLEPPRYLDYSTDPETIERLPYTVNKIFRYLLNDLCAIAMIYGLFGETRYVRFAFYVMTFGLVVLLPIYLLLFFSQAEGYSSMISHLHRL